MKKTLIFSLSLILLFFCGCTPKVVEEQLFAFDTIIDLKIYGGEAEKAIRECENRLSEIDFEMSHFKDGSELGGINAKAGREKVPVGNEMRTVIEKALYFSKISNGAFDISILPVRDLWDFDSAHPELPNKADIDAKLPLVGYNGITLDDVGVSFAQDGMGLDLGGIAKGYAADEINRVLDECGVQNAIIDLGGNIYVKGRKNGTGDWTIGIQNPLLPRGDAFAKVAVQDCSVVTSGTYERYFEKDGKRYHHILDPSTGYPVDSGLISVTIISKLSIDGDALSTACFVLGKEKGMRLIEGLDGIEAVFVDSSKHVYTTEGVKAKLTITDQTYELK